MLPNVIAQFRWLSNQIVAQFGAHGLLSSAAALTYTTLFAVVPLMTVSYAMLSMFPDFAMVGEQIQGFVFENFVPASSAEVQEKLNDFSHQARELTIAGFALLFVTAYLTLVSIEKAFNEIWQVTVSRRGLQRFLVYWGVLTCGPPLVVGGLLVSSYVMSLPVITDADTVGVRATLLGYLPPLLSCVAFTVLFAAMPNCRVRFKHALIGGVLTMLFFEAAKRVFTEVVANANMQLIYGTFAAVPLFLTWLYLVWVLVLSGAIVVRTLGLERDDVRSDGAPPLVQCVRMLAFLHCAHQQGRTVTRSDLNDAVKLSSSERELVLSVLTELSLLSNGEHDVVLLGRDLRAVSLLQLFRRLPQGLGLEQLEEVHDLPRLIEPLRDYARAGAERLAVDIDWVVSEPVEESRA